MPLFYLDSSALVKLVHEEPESGSLLAFLADSDLLTSELVLTEVPRAIRRAAELDPRVPRDALLERAGLLLDAVALVPLDRSVLLAAGTLEGVSLRSLDAIHIATALLVPIDGFVGYDERQAAAARLAGLRTVAPAG
jgi:predicted nucleic acid-binding protein